MLPLENLLNDFTSKLYKDFYKHVPVGVKGKTPAFKSPNILDIHNDSTLVQKNSWWQVNDTSYEHLDDWYYINQYWVPQNVRKYQMTRIESIDNLGIKWVMNNLYQLKEIKPWKAS